MMNLLKQLLLVLLCIYAQTGFTQTIRGQISNTAGNPLPFATIKLTVGNQGIIAGLNGNFTIPSQTIAQQIDISFTGYTSKKIIIQPTDTLLNIILETAVENLANVVVSVKNNSKVKRILNKVVANKDSHNPDKYPEYHCRVYYKMVADNIYSYTMKRRFHLTDSTQPVRRRRPAKHLFLTETQSIRHWKQPQQFQEEVLASRMSGFKTPLINSFITDILPFHAYSDFINLNGKDYNSPISKGLFQRFNFSITDELLQGSDTIWVISFVPKQNAGDLRGKLYIHSNGYAINNLLAYTSDPLLKKDIGIEQQYIFVNNKWFPQQLNYTLQIHFGDTAQHSLSMKGTSVVDSVEWTQVVPHHFQKAYSVKVLPGAEAKTDSQWQQLRPVQLDKKEARTYVFMDSISEADNWEKKLGFIKKLPEGKFAVGKLDVNINRLYSYNRYEKNRPGLGLQTNEKIAKNFSIGGWLGYGFYDKKLKYAGFAEWYFDVYKEHILKFSYSKDIKDPGRLQIHKELDNNYVRQFLLYRVDEVRAYTISLQNRLGYFATQLSATYQKIIPQYAYALQWANKQISRFTNYEVALDIRYAFAEKRIPMFGRYYNSGTKYPIIYSRINTGTIPENAISYVQALTAVSWKKHINRIGQEKFLLVGGISQSNKPLPLSKLFAGNGFLNDKTALHFFGGMQTIRPYDYYMDKFINFYWEHSFDFRLYNVAFLKRKFSSAPTIGLGTNMILGNMEYRAAQQLVTFEVPDNMYIESGLLLNSLLRMRFFNSYFLSLQTGYFYHFGQQKNLHENARFVFGLSVEF